MKKLEVVVPELAFIAATRGLAGVGIGLLVADQLRPETRRAAGWALIGLGVLTTIPIAASVLGRMRDESPED